jgi:hypothetical protein
MSNPNVLKETISIYLEIVTDRARHYKHARLCKQDAETLNEAGDYEMAALYKKDYLAHRRAIGTHNMLLTDLCNSIDISDVWN